MRNVFAREFRPKLVDSLRGYSLAQFGRDAMAGSIVGVVALPLAIAFGIASGVTPEAGIFTAILGGLLVSLLGGCNVQIGGPTGAFIVIVYGIIAKFGLNGLMVATLMAGLLMIMLASLRLGSLVKYIPYPIIVGFTAGIAVTIFSTQINDLFGLGLTEVPGDFVEKWGVYFSHLLDFQWLPLVFGVVSILVIAYSPRLSPRIPGSLVALVLLTGLWYVLKRFAGLEGLECIGDRYQIASSLPRPQMPRISYAMVRDLLPSAITIALLGSIESLLSASVADGVTGDRHRANAELMAQGVANLAVPFIGGVPVTGAIARTMTNINNGGKTPVAGLIHALVLALLLLFLGPLMDFIPMAVLAGVLVVVAYNMSGWRSVIHVLRGPRGDAAVMLVTFLLTVIFDLTVAIEIGLLFAMLLFMRRMIGSASITVMDRELRLDREERQPGSPDETLQIPDGVTVYEIEGPYFFGIANRFEETMKSVGCSSRVQIIRMRRVPFMDSTAVYNLKTLIGMSQAKQEQIVLSGVQTNVLRTLMTTGIVERLGAENVLPNIHLALRRANEILAEQIVKK